MERHDLRAAYAKLPDSIRIPIMTCLALLLLFGIGMTMPAVVLFTPTGHYLPIHTLLEMFSVAVSFMVFVAGWQLRHSRKAGHLPLLGGAFLAVALVDGMHALSYAGMPTFITANSPEKAINFWLVGRFIALSSLLMLALLTAKSRAPFKHSDTTAWISALTGVGVSTLVFYIVIYQGEHLPRTFIPGEGLTPFKIGAEYLLVAIGLAALALFIRLAIRSADKTAAWLATATLAFTLSELFFTRYDNVTDLMNLLGHIFKAIGCLAIYVAFFTRSERYSWWHVGSRIRLFVLILAGGFVVEYFVMLSLPFMIPEGSSITFEAVIDASAMAILAATVIIIVISRFQSRAMRAEYALDHSKDGYCVINDRGNLIDANASFCQMLGCASKEIRSLNIFDFEAPDLNEENRINLRHISERHHATYLTQFRHPNGDTIDLEVNASHLPDVESIVLFLQDISAFKRFEQKIDNLAYYDQLTQLPNRQLLLEHLTAAMNNSAKSGQYGALLAINLDDFKQLNHARGTDIGDEFLLATSGHLTAAVGEHGTVSRLGGDEFAIIVESLETTADRALANSQAMAEKLRASIATPIRLGRRGEVAYRGSACLGITLFLDQREMPEVLLRQATIAMHEAKNAHHNAIRFYSGEMQAVANERIELTEALRQAIEREELELYYQPQVERDGRIHGAEALLRWQTSRLGFVSPAQFIPLAEETGLILPLGRWVLRQACRQLKAWQQAFDLGDFSLSVNVSASQFREGGFVEGVRKEVEESGIEPETLKLELTESMLVDNIRQTTRSMQELNRLGIGFSLDDFGTGYSSLSYLTKLPLDQLKIDKSFVHYLDSNPNNVAVVRTIINMGEALDLQIIAEGVETEAELALLERNGCHAHQGYLFSKPIPAAGFASLLAQGRTDTPAAT